MRWPSGVRRLASAAPPSESPIPASELLGSPSCGGEPPLLIYARTQRRLPPVALLRASVVAVSRAGRKVAATLHALSCRLRNWKTIESGECTSMTCPAVESERKETGLRTAINLGLLTGTVLRKIRLEPNRLSAFFDKAPDSHPLPIALA